MWKETICVRTAFLPIRISIHLQNEITTSTKVETYWLWFFTIHRIVFIQIKRTIQFKDINTSKKTISVWRAFLPIRISIPLQNEITATTKVKTSLAIIFHYCIVFKQIRRIRDVKKINKPNKNEQFFFMSKNLIPWFCLNLYEKKTNIKST